MLISRGDTVEGENEKESERKDLHTIIYSSLMTETRRVWWVRTTEQRGVRNKVLCPQGTTLCINKRYLNKCQYLKNLNHPYYLEEKYGKWNCWFISSLYRPSNWHRNKMYLIVPVFNNKSCGLIAYFLFNS